MKLYARLRYDMYVLLFTDRARKCFAGIVPPSAESYPMKHAQQMPWKGCVAQLIWR